MSYIYVLKQKEKGWRKVGKSINPRDRIKKLESSWSNFDEDSIVYKIDTKKYGKKLDSVEKLIHNTLYSKSLKIDFEDSDSNNGKEGYTEFFKLEEDNIEKLIDFMVGDFVTDKKLYTEIFSEKNNKLSIERDIRLKRNFIKREREKLVELENTLEKLENGFTYEINGNYYCCPNYDDIISKLPILKKVEFCQIKNLNKGYKNSYDFIFEIEDSNEDNIKKFIIQFLEMSIEGFNKDFRKFSLCNLCSISSISTKLDNVDIFKSIVIVKMSLSIEREKFYFKLLEDLKLKYIYTNLNLKVLEEVEEFLEDKKFDILY